MPMNINDYINTVSPENVPLPDWSHLGVSSEGTEKISWNSIYIDDYEHNNSKVESHTALEIENIRMSFANGVDTSQFPPAVVRQPGAHKPYRLVYGFGRSEALRSLETKEWFFTVLKGSDDAIEDVQASENEGLPKRLNGENDMRKFLIQKVRTGKIDRTEEALRTKFNKVYPNRGKEVVSRVIASVMEQLDIHQPYIIYTSLPRSKDWIENHSAEEFVVDGEFDETRDMFGAIMKEGYHYRTIHNAIRKFIDTGKKTYVIYHCKAPTAKASLPSRRLNVIKTIESMKRDYLSLGVKEENWPIVIAGALPQDKEKDNMKYLCGPGEFAR